MPLSWDQPIKEELRMVEEEIMRNTRSKEPLLTEIATHVISSGGKRMRPGIALLSFRAVGGTDLKKTIMAAAAFELIHSATLVHDDINDGAETRRGSIAAYRKYGTQRALITGDFLFVRGFRLEGCCNLRTSSSWSPMPAPRWPRAKCYKRSSRTILACLSIPTFA